MFLAFRGFGGPDCGVGVIADRENDAKMRLGALNGATPGVGNCMYYNPFSNAIEYSQQPGARFETERNPSYRADLANSEALRQWLNEEVGLSSTADMLVADATLTGTLSKNVWGQRELCRGVSIPAGSMPPATPTMWPMSPKTPAQLWAIRIARRKTSSAPISSQTCIGPITANQTVHRFFGEIPLSLGERFDVQLAGNYEFHNFASSFDPKFGWRVQLSQSETHSLFCAARCKRRFARPRWTMSMKPR